MFTKHMAPTPVVTMTKDRKPSEIFEVTDFPTTTVSTDNRLMSSPD